MHEFDKGCGFAIVTNDMVKEKIEEQLDKATKAKIDPTSRLSRFRKNFANLEKNTSLKTRLILNYIHPTPFHQVFFAQSKCKKREKNSHASHCIHNRYATLWNIKISCRYHSADTQQKPRQSKKTQNHLFRKVKPGQLNQMKYKFHMMSIFIHQYRSIKQLM